MEKSNPIILNCIHHSDPDVKSKFIIVTKSDFEEVSILIHPNYLPHVENALHQMSTGIDFCFWYDELGKIKFEG